MDEELPSLNRILGTARLVSASRSDISLGAVICAGKMDAGGYSLSCKKEQKYIDLCIVVVGCACMYGI